MWRMVQKLAVRNARRPSERFAGVNAHTVPQFERGCRNQDREQLSVKGGVLRSRNKRIHRQLLSPAARLLLLVNSQRAESPPLLRRLIYSFISSKSEVQWRRVVDLNFHGISALLSVLPSEGLSICFYRGSVSRERLAMCHAHRNLDSGGAGCYRAALGYRWMTSL